MNIGKRDDLITLQATSSFWFANLDKVDPRGARYVSPGQRITIPRGRYPMYGNAAKEIVEGTLRAPVVPQRSFVDQMVEKGAEVAAKVKQAVSDTVAGKFPCAVCGQVFKVQKGLDIHTRNAHPERAE